MGIRFYLAMTEEEMAERPQLPPAPGWMACHFSPYGIGLTDLPQTLPTGALLCCDDRIPVLHHHADLVAQQLADTATRLECSAILLDFQQPDQEILAQVVRSVCDSAPCPVAVTPNYAAESSGPVLLPPGKLWEPLSKVTESWPGRELWMEWAPQAYQIQVTQNGSDFQSLASMPPSQSVDRTDEALCCRYRLCLEPDRATFLLWDSAETMTQKQSVAEAAGITTLVGLYQQFDALQPT